MYALTVLPEPFGPTMSVSGDCVNSITWCCSGEKLLTPCINSFSIEDIADVRQYVSIKRIPQYQKKKKRSCEFLYEKYVLIRLLD